MINFYLEEGKNVDFNGEAKAFTLQLKKKWVWSWLLEPGDSEKRPIDKYSPEIMYIQLKTICKSLDVFTYIIENRNWAKYCFYKQKALIHL